MIRKWVWVTIPTAEDGRAAPERRRIISRQGLMRTLPGEADGGGNGSIFASGDGFRNTWEQIKNIG
jgi:hypothetical protein